MTIIIPVVCQDVADGSQHEWERILFRGELNRANASQHEWERILYRGDLDSAKNFDQTNLILDHQWDLVFACQEGHRQLALWLLENIPYTDDDYNAGLFCAGFCGDETLMNLMLDCGANDFSCGFCGACQGGHVKLVGRMIQNSKHLLNFESALIHSVRGGHFELVKRMHMLGGKVDHTLYTACWGGNPIMVQWLIEMGADDWEKGLWGALQGHQWKIAQDMVRRGIDLKFIIHMMTYFSNNVDVLEFLICAAHDVPPTLTLDSQVLTSLLNRGIKPQVFGTKTKTIVDMRQKKQKHVVDILGDALDCDTVGVVIDHIAFD